jgi:energy-converting hydrogenase Eha subunit B
VHRREVGEVGEGHGRVGVEVQQLLGRHVREAAAALAGGLAMSEKRSAPTRSGSVSSATSWMATWTGTPGGGGHAAGGVDLGGRWRPAGR